MSCVFAIRAGVIKPTRISDSGKPVPVEHVAELLEGMSSTHQTQHDNDSESD